LAKNGLPDVALAKNGLPDVALAKNGLPDVALAKSGGEARVRTWISVRFPT